MTPFRLTALTLRLMWVSEGYRNEGASRKDYKQCQVSGTPSLACSSLSNGGGDEIQMWPCPLAFQPTKPLAGPDSHFRNESYQEEEGAGDPS